MKNFFILLGSNSTRNLMLLLAVGLFSFGNAQNWLWADSYGGTVNDRSNDVVTDTQENVYIVGTFFSPTVNFGSHQLVNQDESDFFWQNLIQTETR
ncbi:MAG: hypothetical protein WCY16_02435 [Weeksellaceae bacterium]